MYDNLPDLRNALETVVKQIALGKRTAITSVFVRLACDFVHGANVQAGWWSDTATGKRVERNVGELLMLCVSELAEVPVPPNIFKRMDDKLPHRRMVEVEIADCLIRLFDLSAGLGWPSWLYVARDDQPDIRATVELALMRVVRHIAAAMECHRRARMIEHAEAGLVPEAALHTGRAIWMLFWICKRWSLDAPNAIAEKIAFNMEREDHKRASRLAAGGKAY